MRAGAALGPIVLLLENLGTCVDGDGKLLFLLPFLLPVSYLTDRLELIMDWRNILKIVEFV